MILPEPLPPALTLLVFLSSSAGVHVRVLAGTVSPSGPLVCRAVAVLDPGGPGRGGYAVGGVSAASADPDLAGEERGGGVAGDGGCSVSLCAASAVVTCFGCFWFK